MATGFSKSSIQKASDLIYDYTCSPCEENDFNSEAAYFCKQCSKQYCDKCVAFHNGMYRNHALLDHNDLQHWGKVKNMVAMEMCEEHDDEKLKMICVDHDQLCCHLCLVNHRSCKSVQLIQDVGKGIQNKPEFKKMSTDVASMNTELNQMKEKKKGNRKALQGTSKQILSTIDNLIQKMNQSLSKLKKDTVEELNQILAEFDSNINDDIDNCNKVEDRLKKLLRDIQNKAAQQEALDYIGFKKCKEVMCEGRELLKDKNQSDCKIEFHPDTNIQQYISSLSKLGQYQTQPATRTNLTMTGKTSVPGAKTTSTPIVRADQASDASNDQSVPGAKTSTPKVRVDQAVTGASDASNDQSVPGARTSTPKVRVDQAVPGASDASNDQSVPGAKTSTPKVRVDQAVPGASDASNDQSVPGAKTSTPKVRVDQAVPGASDASNDQSVPGAKATSTPKVRADQSVPEESDASNDQSVPGVKKAVSTKGKINRTLQGTTATNKDQIYTVQAKNTYPVKVYGDNNTCKIGGMCQLPSGNIVINDESNSKVKLLDQKYAPIAHCYVPGLCGSICHTTGMEVAVVVDCDDSIEIHFINASNGNLETTRTVKLDHNCNCRLAHNSGHLFVGTQNEIYVYTMSGNKVECLYENNSVYSTVKDIAVSDDGQMIYAVNWDIHKLVTLDNQAKQLATLSDPDLWFPSCVCVAGNGHVFTCSSKNVLQVDATGRQKLATVISGDGELAWPESLFFNRATSQLIVGVRLEDDIFVFTMK